MTDGAEGMEAFADVERFAARVRSRLTLEALLTAAAVVAIAVVGVLGTGAAAILAFGPHPAVRIVSLAVLVGAVAAAALLPVVGVVVRRRRPLEVARYIEASVPGLRSGVVSCLEFRPRLAAILAEGRTSPALLAALAERTRDRLATVRVDRLVTARRPASLAVVLGSLLVALVVTTLVNPELWTSGVRVLLAGTNPLLPRAVSRQPVVVSVLVSDLAVAYRFPDYTNLPPSEETNGAGDLRGLVGTRATLTMQALVEARAAELVLRSKPDEPVPLAVGPGGRISGELVLAADDTYRFRIRKPDGVLLEEAITRSIEAVPDETPRVRLRYPEEDLEVNLDDRIELAFRARDDFGIGDVALAYEREGDAGVPVHRPLGPDPLDAEGYGRVTLDLKGLGVRPGERLSVWIEATDNDTVSGPKTGRSVKRVVHIYSPDEKHDALLADERALFERMLQVLGDRLVLPEPWQVPAEDPEKFIEALTTGVNESGRLLDEVAAVLERMREDPLTPQDAVLDLSEVRSRLATLLDEEKGLLRSTLLLEGFHRHAPDRQRALAQHNVDTVTELEKAALLVDRMVDRQHQERSLDDGRELVQQTRDLVDMLSKLEKGGDDALKLQIARELEQLERGLDRMADGLRRQAKELPYDRFNPSSLGDRGTMRSLRSFKDRIADVKKLIQEGRLAEARAALEGLLGESEEMMASLEGEFAEESSARMARSGRRLERARGRLDRIAEAQGELHEQTSAQEGVYRDRVQSELADRLERLVRREEANVSDLERRLRAVDREALHPDDRKSLEQTLRDTEDVRKMLGEGDVGQASKVADRVERSVQALEQEVGQGALLAADPARSRELRRAERRLSEAEAPARELAEGLREMLPDPRSLLDGREQRGLERLGRRQADLRDKLQKLRGGMGQLAEDQPGLQGQLDRLVQEAEQSMRQASERLAELNPSLAEEHQRSALEKLGQARQQLDEAARAPRQMAGEGVGVGDHRKSVEIPRADDYQVPAAFRQELLEAMRAEAPPLYRKLVDQYYEALIK